MLSASVTLLYDLYLIQNDYTAVSECLKKPHAFQVFSLTKVNMISQICRQNILPAESSQGPKEELRTALAVQNSTILLNSETLA